ncbi:unnamed protein product [Schistocephalus solidus]|uniref:Profilin n=1 Tax=Schistocephalus solidus TaxID=70667 RepID=A0A183TCP6_SCHSO|nr:unnamed protein product [Schistocephalus solidus]
MPTSEQLNAWTRFIRAFKSGEEGKMPKTKEGKHRSFTCGLSKRKSRSKEEKTTKVEQSSKLKRTKNPKVKGNVSFEKNGQSEMWDGVVKKSLCGTKIVIKAVICNADSRKIYAYEPSDFTPSMEQCQKVMELMEGRDISKEVFTVAEDNFEVVTFSEHGFLIAKTSRPKSQGGKESKSEGEGQPTRNLIGFKTDYIVMLGVCAQNQLDAALGLFKDMHEYVLSL